MDQWRFEALANCHENLIEVIAALHQLTAAAPRSIEWDNMRDEVSCLDSIADIMRRALTE